MTANSCLLDATAADLTAHLGAPVVPDIAWLTEIPEAVRALPAGLRTMGWVDMCGDVGRFYSFVAEDGVPFTDAYGNIVSPIAAGARSYYMNERTENLMGVRDGDELTYIAAGPIGFGHSPESLLFDDELFDFHDRRNLAGLDRPLARARLGVEGVIVYATGVLMPDVLFGEAVAILQSEVSPEFALIDDGPATPAYLEYLTLSLVKQGNTRTSQSMANHRRRAAVRRVHRRADRQPTQGATPMHTNSTHTIITPGPADAAAAVSYEPVEGMDLGELRAEVAELAARLERQAQPPPCNCSAAVDDAAEAPDVADDLAERVAVIEGELHGLIEFLMTPPPTVAAQRAAINTHNELRAALEAALSASYAATDVYVYVVDVSEDNTTVYYEIGSEGNARLFREEFTFATDQHEVTLAGSPVEVVREVEYIDA